MDDGGECVIFILVMILFLPPFVVDDIDAMILFLFVFSSSCCAGDRDRDRDDDVATTSSSSTPPLPASREGAAAAPAAPEADVGGRAGPTPAPPDDFFIMGGCWI